MRGLLTFELTADGDELFINCDREGLSKLAGYIEGLARSKKDLPNDVHLLTDSWAGNELSEDNQLEGSKLLNKVTIRLT